MIGYLQVLAAVSIWAVINGLVVKGIKETSAIAIGTYMSWTGVVIFLIFFQKINSFENLSNYQLIILVCLGAAAALNNALFYTALKMTFVYNAALLHYFASILVILLVVFVPMFKEVITSVDVIAIIVGFIGLFIITVPNFSGSSGKWVFFALGSAVFYSFEMAFSRLVSTHGVLPETSALTKLLAQGLIMPLAAIPLRQSLKIKNGKEAVQMLGAGVLLYLSFVLYFSGTQLVPVRHTAVLGYVDRIGAIMLGAYFFKEKLTKNIWFGGSLIIVAGLLVVILK